MPVADCTAIMKTSPIFPLPEADFCLPEQSHEVLVHLLNFVAENTISDEPQIWKGVINPLPADGMQSEEAPGRGLGYNGQT